MLATSLGAFFEKIIFIFLTLLVNFTQKNWYFRIDKKLYNAKKIQHLYSFSAKFPFTFTLFKFQKKKFSLRTAIVEADDLNSWQLITEFYSLLQLLNNFKFKKLKMSSLKTNLLSGSIFDYVEDSIMSKTWKLLFIHNRIVTV